MDVVVSPRRTYNLTGFQKSRNQFLKSQDRPPALEVNSAFPFHRAPVPCRQCEASFIEHLRGRSGLLDRRKPLLLTPGAPELLPVKPGITKKGPFQAVGLFPDRRP